MRKVVAVELVSLDGVMESPEEWAFPYSNDEMEEANGIIGSSGFLLVMAPPFRSLVPLSAEKDRGSSHPLPAIYRPPGTRGLRRMPVEFQVYHLVLRPDDLERRKDIHE